MKKFVAVVLFSFLMMFSMGSNADARTGDTSVLTHKSGKNITVYVKNHSNKSNHKVNLQLVKDNKNDGKPKFINVSKNKQVSVKYKLSKKGKYKFKYTNKGKTFYTKTFDVK